MEIRSKIFKRFSSALFAKVISIFVSSVLTIFLARFLGSDGYGLLFLSLSILSIAKLFSKLGVSKSASTYIAEYKQKDTGQIKHIINFSLKITSILVSVIILFMFLASGNISDILDEDMLSNFLKLGTLFVLFATLTSYNRHILQGFEDIEAASALSVINKLLRLMFVLIFILIGLGALGALFGYIIATLVSSLVGIYYIYRYKYLVYESSAIEPDLKKRIFEYSIPLAFTHTAHSIDSQFDRILIGFFLGPVSVAYYTIGKQVIQFTEAPASTLGFSLTPTYGSQVAKGNIQEAKELYTDSLFYTLCFYIPIAVGMVVLANPGIRIIFGEDYTGAVPVLQILAVFGVLQAVSKVTSHGLDYLRRARDRAILKSVSAVLNIILNLIFIPEYGVVGAAIATVITFSIYSLGNVYIMVAELEISISYKTFIINVFTIVSISLCVGAVAVFATSHVDGVLSLVFSIIAGAFVWVISCFAFGVINYAQIKKIIVRLQT